MRTCYEENELLIEWKKKKEKEDKEEEEEEEEKEEKEEKRRRRRKRKRKRRRRETRKRRFRFDSATITPNLTSIPPVFTAPIYRGTVGPRRLDGSPARRLTTTNLAQYTRV